MRTVFNVQIDGVSVPSKRGTNVGTDTVASEAKHATQKKNGTLTDISKKN